MITLQEKDKGQIQVTLGDRNGDGKVDLTVEAALRIPSLMGGLTSPHVAQLGPFTENIPVEQAEEVLAGIAKGGIAAAGPAIGGAVGWVFHAASGVFHIKV